MFCKYKLIGINFYYQVVNIIFLWIKYFLVTNISPCSVYLNKNKD